MTKTLLTAIAATLLTATVASALLQTAVDAYPVDLDVSTLTKAERLHVANLLSSGDSPSEINRALEVLAK